MSEKRGFRDKYRIVFRRSSPLLKCMILAVILLSIVTLLALRSGIMDARAETEANRQQAIALEQENQKIDQRIFMSGTVEGIRKIATELLGLVDPNSEFFVLKTSPE